MSYHKIFCLCVNFLEWAAGIINRVLPSTRMDYIRINVLIFCVVWPLITAALASAVVTLILKPSWAVAFSKLLGVEDPGLPTLLP